jgi:hypothetical protein
MFRGAAPRAYLDYPLMLEALSDRFPKIYERIYCADSYVMPLFDHERPRRAIDSNEIGTLF